MVPVEVTYHPDVTNVVQYDALVTPTARNLMVFKSATIILKFLSYLVW